MVKVIIVKKTTNLKLSDIKNFDLENLYKKCNLRKPDNFEKRHTWKMTNSDYYITLYAKDAGRSNSENKYDLPPPVDKKLYFGSLLLVKHKGKELSNENVKDITLEEWATMYNKLFGGFEDLNGEDSWSEEEEIPEHMKTKQGYSKEGGFIVDDDVIDDDDYIPDESDDDIDAVDDDDADEEEDNMGHDSDINSVEDNDEEEDEEDSGYESDASDVGSELSEESYVDSDEENK